MLELLILFVMVFVLLLLVVIYRAKRKADVVMRQMEARHEEMRQEHARQSAEVRRALDAWKE